MTSDSKPGITIVSRHTIRKSEDGPGPQDYNVDATSQLKKQPRMVFNRGARDA